MIVLVNVYYPESGYGTKLNCPPLGIAYISEYLDRNKIEHLVIDQGLGYSPEYILGKIALLKPSWIGVSLNSILIDKSNELIKKIKTDSPSTRIVVGGPHVTTKWKNIFADIPAIDYAIAGEGEESFFELVTGREKETIKGLIYRDEIGKVVSNEKRITPDIDNIPFPTFRKFELDSYSEKIIPLISSRGCPYKCTFCQQSSLLSKEWRGVSAKYFLDVLEYWKERGYRNIHILDDNFAHSTERLKQISEQYVGRGLNELRLTLVGGIRINSATQDNLEMLKKIGVEYISFGIESFSDKVLRAIKKGVTEKQIEAAIKMATEMKFKVRLFFIIGLPYQTVESLRITYKKILQYPVYQVRFFNLIPYENTSLFDWVQENGKLLYSPKEYMNNFKAYQEIPVFESKNTMTVEERTRELKIARDFVRLIDERSKYLFDELD
jgi:radical SAM superfamily enzyme YgiQ (UPF0313 family)